MLEEGETLGARVVVVAFARPESLVHYQRGLGLDDVLVLSDPERETYRMFGFDRASFRRVWLDPRVWLRYAELLARGRRPRPAQEDPLQLGGDVLTDPAGRVRWIYRSSGPEDRPSLAAVAEEIDKIDVRPRPDQPAGR